MNMKMNCQLGCTRSGIKKQEWGVILVTSFHYWRSASIRSDIFLHWFSQGPIVHSKEWSVPNKSMRNLFTVKTEWMRKYIWSLHICVHYIQWCLLLRRLNFLIFVVVEQVIETKKKKIRTSGHKHKNGWYETNHPHWWIWNQALRNAH